MPIASVGPAAPRAAGAAAPRPRFAAALEARAGRATGAAARAGRTFTSGELLALQAEAYRCAQVVDLGAKLAEQGAQAVKQALNTQL